MCVGGGGHLGNAMKELKVDEIQDDKQKNKTAPDKGAWKNAAENNEIWGRTGNKQ